MKRIIHTALFAAGMITLFVLTACGAGQGSETGAAGAYQSHTFDFDGNLVLVSVDTSDGWEVSFNEGAVDLYEGLSESGEPVPAAFGVYESGETYEALLLSADPGGAFLQEENGVTFTDSVGMQDYIIRLGSDAYFRIMVLPGHEAQEIFDRFDVELVQSAPPAEEENIFLTLVNRTHKLPDDWENRIELLEAKNYFGEDIRVEKNTYNAFQLLRSALLEEGVDIELGSSYRSVERQKDLWAEYEAAYGLDYCKQYVAVPGFSEHHTGFAVDVNLIQGDSQADEAEKQKERDALWGKVHQKLPEYGFILRYLPERDDITGYAYEPWHIRYVGDPETAGTITEQGITLEEYLGQVEPSNATVDYGPAGIYTLDDRKAAVAVLRSRIDTWEGCQLHSIRYAGDGCSTPENLAWMNSLGDGRPYVACIEFLTDFRSPAENSGSLEPDTEYSDYPWWLARTAGGEWDLLTWGY